MPKQDKENEVPAPAAEGPVSRGAVYTTYGAAVERTLWLQRMAGNAVVTRLLQQQRLGSVQSRGRRRVLPRQAKAPEATTPEDRAIRAVADRAFAAGGPDTWATATTDIVQRIVKTRLPQRLGRLGDIAYNTELRQVKPGTETGGKLQLVATDTVVRYVHNGYLESLVRQVEAAFLRSDIEHQFRVAIADGSEDWSLSDTRDLQSALNMLSAAELKFVVDTRFMRVSVTPDQDADALTRVEGSDKRVWVSDIAFGRKPGDVAGITVYGGSTGRYAIIHECGHVIDFQNDRSEGRSWKAIDAHLRKEGIKVSSEPKGDPAKQPAVELFAEAFARFHVDPAGLKADDEKTYAFFNNRSHL